MTALPRIALGTLQPGVDSTPMQWALLDALEQMGLRIQMFSARAQLADHDGATPITGVAPRHLDSWLMSPEVCKAALVRGLGKAQLAVIEGRYRSALTAEEQTGGQLEELCQWLDLPQVGVLDVSLMASGELSCTPPRVDALILDRVTDEHEFVVWQTLLETVWQIPVLGGLGRVSELRRLVASLPQGARPSHGLCRALGNQLLGRLSVSKLLRLAASRDLPSAAHEPTPTLCTEIEPTQKSASVHRALYGGSADFAGLRIAVAYDDAFHAYFLDTLDVLEQHGAEICDFSPLNDERLPEQTDIVYLGCGQPELFAAELAQNSCLVLALREHLCNGQRLYAEAGGLAYLCRAIETSDGQSVPMAGLLPLVARHNNRGSRIAAEIEVDADCWLGSAGSAWRGYMDQRWEFSSLGSLHCFDRRHIAGGRLLGLHQAVGSRLQTHFGCQPHLLGQFFAPHAAALDLLPVSATR